MSDENQKPIQTRRDLETRIVTRAWREPAYKQRLLKDPKGVLEDELRSLDPTIRLPSDLKVAVHEESANAYHLVLPRNPREITLSDVANDDLEALAPQTVAIIILGVVAANTVGVVNNVGNTNVGANVNVAANVNAAATSTSVG